MNKELPGFNITIDMDNKRIQLQCQEMQNTSSWFIKARSIPLDANYEDLNEENKAIDRMNRTCTLFKE